MMKTNQLAVALQTAMNDSLTWQEGSTIAERIASHPAMVEFATDALLYRQSRHTPTSSKYGEYTSCSCGKTWPCQEREAILAALGDES